MPFSGSKWNPFLYCGSENIFSICTPAPASFPLPVEGDVESVAFFKFSQPLLLQMHGYKASATAGGSAKNRHLSSSSRWHDPAGPVGQQLLTSDLKVKCTWNPAVCDSGLVTCELRVRRRCQSPQGGHTHYHSTPQTPGRWSPKNTSSIDPPFAGKGGLLSSALDLFCSECFLLKRKRKGLQKPHTYRPFSPDLMSTVSDGPVQILLPILRGNIADAPFIE